MSQSTPNVKDIFDRAAEIDSPDEREAYLAEACAGAPDVRREIEELLRAYAQAGSFLDRPAIVTADLPSTQPGSPPHPAAEIGTIIAGRYKLLQALGEGGMGSVFLAEQTQPVKRRVAVKVVKAGMDSKQVLARFEAERQALALMDHPNIAKVLDAGSTEGGHPFFVMELVRGVPLTQFCDEKKLSVGDRLQIFQQVCHAVQHAHQKGIIHRDLKPSNILVESHESRPLPKVIDFGLAKALSAMPLTDRSLFTNFGAAVGTPLYMAPEQAELGAVDVDTRADVYALGVILYELLTGTTPLEKKRLAAAAWDEIRRVIREEEPPTPSARLSTSETPKSIAEHRHTEPGKLGRFVRGDLDWIVMKALAKDRERRYDTANAFAADVGRFLSDEPVLAGPPTLRYKVQKFLRRNRGQVRAALLAFALVVGIIGTTWGLILAADAREAERRARDETAAKAEELRQEKIRAALEKGRLEVMLGNFKSAEEAAYDAARAGAPEGDVRMLRGQIELNQGNFEEAVKHLRRAVELLESVASRGLLAYAYGKLGDMTGYYRTFAVLGQPTTPEDFLFKGLGESLADAEKGLATIDEAFKMRESPVTLLVRAEVRTNHLQQVDPDPKMADRAVADATAIRVWLSNSPAALRISLRIHLVAMCVYESAGDKYRKQFEEARIQAMRDDRDLGKFANLFDVAEIRYYFLRHEDRKVEAFQELRRSYTESSEHPAVAYLYAEELYWQGEYLESLKVIEKAKGQDWMRLLAAVEQPDGRRLAQQMYSVMSEKDRDPWRIFNRLLILHVFGERKKIDDDAKLFLSQRDSFPAARRKQFEQAVMYLAGELSEEDFLRAKDMNRGDLSNAHLAVGLKYLSNGNRAKAREHFQKTFDLKVFDFIPYDVSYLLLNRMKQDENWPPWIDTPKP